jgi:hypothetical protein
VCCEDDAEPRRSERFFLFSLDSCQKINSNLPSFGILLWLGQNVLSDHDVRSSNAQHVYSSAIYPWSSFPGAPLARINSRISLLPGSSNHLLPSH